MLAKSLISNILANTVPYIVYEYENICLSLSIYIYTFCTHIYTYCIYVRIQVCHLHFPAGFVGTKFVSESAISRPARDQKNANFI